MSKRTAKILAILFTFFSLSAIKETYGIITDKNMKMSPWLAIILTALFIWAAIYFWSKSKKTEL